MTEDSTPTIYDVFNRMAALERTLGHTCLREPSTVKGDPLWLDDVDPDRGNHATEPDIECSLLCAIAEQDIA